MANLVSINAKINERACTINERDKCYIFLSDISAKLFLKKMLHTHSTIAVVFPQWKNHFQSLAFLSAEPIVTQHFL